MPDENVSVPQPGPTLPGKFNWKKVLLIGVLIFILLAVLLYGFIMLSVYIDKSKLPGQETKSNPASQATPSAQKDETADWKAFTRKGISFNYPPTWTIKENLKDSYGSDYISLTSPNGFILSFYPELTGRGGGCTPDSPQLVNVNTFAKKEVEFENIRGKKVYIVEWGISGGFLESNGSNYTRKVLQLSDSSDFPKLGDNGKNCLIYSNSTQGDMGFESKIGYSTTFKGAYPDDSEYQELSSQEYFNLSEVKDAENILRSVTY